MVIDDPITVDGDLYVVKHLIVSNEMVGVGSSAYVAEELHIIANMEFVAADMEFFIAGVDSLVVDVDEDLWMKHCIQFVLGCEHADWVADM